MSENQAELSKEPRACCACLQVKYDPEPVGETLMRDRWCCALCGTEFVRQGRFDALQDQVAVDTAIIKAKNADIERLTTEVSDLKAFRDAVVGWREFDWVEGFCRKTAEHVAENAKCVQRTYRNEPVSSSQRQGETHGEYLERIGVEN